MLYGIALLSNLPFRITCDVKLASGHGDIIISGPVEPTIEETINAAINYANELCDFGEGTFPDLSNRNIHIRLRLPVSPAPIVGPSYGLLLSISIILALLQRQPTLLSYITGAVDGAGNVLPVGGIERKRRGVAQLGGERLILPASQLDFFSQDVIQIPVSNVFEAYRAVMYG